MWKYSFQQYWDRNSKKKKKFHLKYFMHFLFRFIFNERTRISNVEHWLAPFWITKYRQSSQMTVHKTKNTFFFCRCLRMNRKFVDKNHFCFILFLFLIRFFFTFNCLNRNPVHTLYLTFTLNFELIYRYCLDEALFCDSNVSYVLISKIKLFFFMEKYQFERNRQMYVCVDCWWNRMKW